MWGGLNKTNIPNIWDIRQLELWLDNLGLAQQAHIDKMLKERPIPFKTQYTIYMAK